jgi:membrane peptidoglycan carboxypeptidase
VWIIENERLVPKQRMYEVYLNIIEWGPGIYGITRAAQYYFNKRPSELTLNESIYLASIVPRPKWFKYTFESNGRPRAFFEAYFNRMKELMVRKEFISSMDTLGVLPIVTLTGPAAMALDTSELRRPPEFIPLEPIRVREFKIE